MVNVIEAVGLLRHTGLVTATGHVVGSGVAIRRDLCGPVDLVLGECPSSLVPGWVDVEVWRRDRPGGPGRVVSHGTLVDGDDLVVEVYGVRLPCAVSALGLLGRLAEVVPGWRSWSDREVVGLALGLCGASSEGR